MEVVLKGILTINQGKFKIAIIKNNDLKEGFTTSDVLEEAETRGYVIPTKEQARCIGETLGNDYASVCKLWAIVSLTKDGYECGASIVSGKCQDNEGKGINNYGKDMNHVWGQGFAFTFLLFLG